MYVKDYRAVLRDVLDRKDTLTKSVLANLRVVFGKRTTPTTLLVRFLIWCLENPRCDADLASLIAKYTPEVIKTMIPQLQEVLAECSENKSTKKITDELPL